MNRVADADIVVYYNGQRLLPKRDGYLGQLAPGRLTLVATTSDNNTYPFVVNGPKEITLLNSDEAPHYQIKMTIASTQDGVCHTKYPANNLRLLRIGLSGKIQIWEIAAISQHGEFFLTAQCTYQTRCYRDNGRIRCPKFEEGPKKWPQLQELLGELLAPEIAQLPQISKYRPAKLAPNGLGLTPNTGRVLWYNAAQGLGAILTPSGVARVHWTQIVQRGRRRYLRKGKLISYSSLVSLLIPKAQPGPYAKLPRPTSFKWEVLSVKPSL